jgi:peptide/nickel transport system substrate-binding protein
LANVLSGEVDITYSNALRFEHALVLKREWSGGAVALAPAAASVVYPQFRPEYQKTPALFDVRVRKALMHAIDKQALQDGLFGGLGIIAHTTVPTDESFFPDLDRVITKYDYDPRKTEALMNEKGFVKDATGFFVDSNGERFRPDFHVLSGLTFEQQGAIMRDTWQRAGIDTNYYVMPTAQSREAVNRHTFSGLGNGRPNTFSADQIGTPENKWAGSNRGGWSRPEYETLYAAFNNSLDRAERDRLQVQMYKLVSDQLPTFMLYFDIKQVAYVNELVGVQATNLWWTLHQWELR